MQVSTRVASQWRGPHFLFQLEFPAAAGFYVLCYNLVRKNKTLKQTLANSVLIIEPQFVASPSNHNENGQSTETLIQQAISGDSAAFGQLYDQYFEKIYRFVYYRVNHRETAEDLVAEVFIKAYDKLSEIRGTKAFNGWLYQIARNLIIDHYRSKKISVDIYELENVLTYDDNLFDKANFSFQQTIFLANLQKLTSDQQIVIKLKFIDDLDNSEIAALLGKSEGAIRVIQHRAINELKNLLPQDQDDEQH